MTYDDAGWHYDTCTEHGLDTACAATHIGIFFAWLAHHDLANRGRVDLASLLDGSTTPGAFVLRIGGEINRSMVTERGHAFCAAAYRAYLGMYEYIPEIARHEVTYAAPDTWATYDAVAPVIQEAYDVFCAQTE